MQTSPTMQRVITALLERHGLTLRPGLCLKLSMGVGMMPLVIEQLHPEMVSVAHYYRQNGDTIADPDVVFVVQADGWAPAEIQQPYSGYANYIKDPAGQRRLVEFAELWARNIEAQGWLERGTVETRHSGEEPEAEALAA